MQLNKKTMVAIPRYATIVRLYKYTVAHHIM
ncbi:hypothetical protein SCA_1288 [Staphylococcus carnosus subsp. carnosus TM300]|uniref:Uncharacterized protein n=1 Tax=Staphylococcus carnosus (strain TM300) TaxID=396513 RepID=B9DNC8_STACT|nr:hypothetical protein SCA_1288 [Staphylococcus carnosus subsp. carnosus TM300]